MKLLTLVTSGVLILSGCSSNKSGSPKSDTGITPAPTSQAHGDRNNKSSTVDYYGHTQILNLGNEVITVTSLLKITESRDGAQNFSEYTQTEYRNSTYYTERTAQLDPNDNFIKLRIQSHFNISQFSISPDPLTLKGFQTLSDKVQKLETSAPINIDVDLIRKNLKLEHSLWTDRCRTAADWTEARNHEPVKVGTQLLDLPPTLALDIYLNTRTSALEFSPSDNNIYAWATRLSKSNLDQNPKDDIIYFGDSLRMANYMWTVSLYNPSKVIHFFRFCARRYQNKYPDWPQNEPYGLFYPTRNSAFESTEIAGLKLLDEKIGGLFYEPKKNAKPIGEPDFSVLPIPQNLKSNDLNYLEQNGFEIPNLKSYQ